MRIGGCLERNDEVLPHSNAPRNARAVRNALGLAARFSLSMMTRPRSHLHAQRVLNGRAGGERSCLGGRTSMNLTGASPAGKSVSLARTGSKPSPKWAPRRVVAGTELARRGVRRLVAVYRRETVSFRPYLCRLCPRPRRRKAFEALEVARVLSVVRPLRVLAAFFAAAWSAFLFAFSAALKAAASSASALAAAASVALLARLVRRSFAAGTRRPRLHPPLPWPRPPRLTSAAAVSSANAGRRGRRLGCPLGRGHVRHPWPPSPATFNAAASASRSVAVASKVSVVGTSSAALCAAAALATSARLRTPHSLSRRPRPSRARAPGEPASPISRAAVSGGDVSRSTEPTPLTSSSGPASDRCAASPPPWTPNHTASPMTCSRSLCDKDGDAQPARASFFVSFETAGAAADFLKATRTLAGLAVIKPLPLWVPLPLPTSMSPPLPLPSFAAFAFFWLRLLFLATSATASSAGASAGAGALFWVATGLANRYARAGAGAGAGLPFGAANAAASGAAGAGARGRELALLDGRRFGLWLGRGRGRRLALRGGRCFGLRACRFWRRLAPRPRACSFRGDPSAFWRGRGLCLRGGRRFSLSARARERCPPRRRGRPISWRGAPRSALPSLAALGEGREAPSELLHAARRRTRPRACAPRRAAPSGARRARARSPRSSRARRPRPCWRQQLRAGAGAHLSRARARCRAGSAFAAGLGRFMDRAASADGGGPGQPPSPRSASTRGAGQSRARRSLVPLLAAWSGAYASGKSAKTRPDSPRAAAERARTKQRISTRYAPPASVIAFVSAPPRKQSVYSASSKHGELPTNIVETSFAAPPASANCTPTTWRSASSATAAVAARRRRAAAPSRGSRAAPAPASSR